MKINTRSDLINVFNNNIVNNLGIEVGTYAGDFAKEILNTYTGKLFLVDTWRHHTDDSYIDIANKIDFKEIYTKCSDNIKGYEDRCFMLKIDSKNASNLFDDDSLDFVYIDANHKYEAVKEDISCWFPKIRKGGILSGHDYLIEDSIFTWNSIQKDEKNKYIFYSDNTFLGEFGVNAAVNEFVQQNNLKLNLTTNEPFGSWFVFK